MSTLTIFGIFAIIILFFLFIRKKTKFILTDEFKEVLYILNNTNEHVFITGKAGTGKSELIKYFKKNTNKKYVILAPTGIASLNVGGQTIHSFFKFPAKLITEDMINIAYEKNAIFNNVEMIIIDEISMVRSDIMNAIDISLQKNLNNNLPFGGKQMVFIGDLFQLPPVLKDEDKEQIFKTYGGQYFFDAPVISKIKLNFKELTYIFRQDKDQTKFKSLLNNLRINNGTHEDYVLLNERYKENAGIQNNSVFLTVNRATSKAINNDELAKINGEVKEYFALLSGNFAELINKSEDEIDEKLPVPYKLILKKGAQIMMLKNDPAKRWVNGTIGKVVKLEDDKITVEINNSKFLVERIDWNEIEYKSNLKNSKIEEQITSTIKQFPMQLSYAMTIHKSQGKTFEKITIDIGGGAFAPGQVYVALSRCTKLNGIVLNKVINPKDVFVNERVVEFYKTKKIPSPLKFKNAEQSKDIIIQILNNAIDKQKSIKIKYENNNGVQSERILSEISYSTDFNEQGYDKEHIKGFCHTRNEERSFKIIRIQKAEIV